MTLKNRNDVAIQPDMKAEILGAVSLEGVIGLGNLELLLDHLERTTSEDRP